MGRRSSVDVFPASQARDSCVPDVDVRRDQHNTVLDVLDRIHKSLNTATRHVARHAILLH